MPTGAPAALQSTHISKSFGRRMAVNDVSLSVAPNEVFAILGPNGSGKSTFLRIVAGYLFPDSGTATICGEDLATNPAAAKALTGYVPDSMNPYPRQSVAEFLHMMGRLRGLPKSSIDDSADRVMALLELSDTRHQKLGELSQGYRQRVAIAQALIAKPKLLILDEPTNGLDPVQVGELRLIIKRVAKTSAVLFSSHVLGEVQRMADRVGVMVEGELRSIVALANNTCVLGVRVEGDIERAVAVTETFGTVDQSQRYRDDFDFSVSLAAGVEQADVVAALVNNGIRVKSVAEKGFDLEKHFRQQLETRGRNEKDWTQHEDDSSR